MVDLISDACVEELSEPPEQATSMDNAAPISVVVSKRLIPKPFPSRQPGRSDGRRALADRDDLTR